MAGKIPDSPLAGLGLSGDNLGDVLGDALTDSAVGGVLSTAPSSKYVTGARCVIKVNGKLAGFAFAVAWRINTSQEEILTIDEYTPHEIAPKRISVEGTMSMFHIPGKGPSARPFMQSHILSFMFHKYITIEITDSKTNQLLFKTNKAVITSRSETIRAEDIATIQLSWKSIGWQDEEEPRLPSGTTETEVGSSDGFIGDIPSTFSSLA